MPGLPEMTRTSDDERLGVLLNCKLYTWVGTPDTSTTSIAQRLQRPLISSSLYLPTVKERVDSYSYYKMGVAQPQQVSIIIQDSTIINVLFSSSHPLCQSAD